MARRALMLSLSLVVLGSLTACQFAGDIRAAETMPAAVSCQDAAQLRLRSSDAQRRGEFTTSDQEKIIANSHASYFATLATVADLMCKGPAIGTEATLAQAFAAARRSEEASSFYERAIALSEANLRATETVRILLKLPAPTSK